MTSPTRRSVMGAAVGGMFGLGCTAALGFGNGVALAQSPGNRIAFPTRPMRLSRRLERSLRGGALLVVSRSWRVEFAGQGQGIGITGVQVHSNVEAPSVLAALADIEQSRSTADMWPMLLSGDGRIMAAGIGTREEDISAALTEAQRIIAQSGAPTSHRNEQRQYLGELAKAGSSLLDSMPDDLFFPIGEPFRSNRTVDLPGGLVGHFEVTYDATCSGIDGWLKSAERQVMTRIGSDEQRANEVWKLTEL